MKPFDPNLYYKMFADIVEKYVGVPLNKIINHWDEPHRVFHTTEHLNGVLEALVIQRNDFRRSIKSELEWEALILAAFFHDIYYVPGDKDNEKKSVKIMNSYLRSELYDEIAVRLAREIILDTANCPANKENGLFIIFQNADCWGLINWRFEDILPYEEKIFKEFRRFSWKEYKQKRVEFLKKSAKFFSTNEYVLNKLADYVNNRKPRIGVYAGSFNPFHRGHLNILEQAEKIFDKVVVAYGINPDKEKQKVIVPKIIEDREVIVYTGLLPTLLKEYESTGCEVTLIRGLRNEYDLNYEQNLISFIRDYFPEVRVAFLLCNKEFEHVSSSSIRSLSEFNADVSKYVVT